MFSIFFKLIWSHLRHLKLTFLFTKNWCSVQKPKGYLHKILELWWSFFLNFDVTKVANKSQVFTCSNLLVAFEMNKIFFDVTGHIEWSTISRMIDRHLSMVWPEQLWINLVWKKSVIGGSTHKATYTNTQ